MPVRYLPPTTTDPGGGGPGGGPGGGTGGTPDPWTPPPPPPPDERLLFSLTRGTRTLPLTGRYQIQVGVQGFDVSASSVLERRAAGVSGTFVEGMDSGSRSVWLPILIRGRSLTELKALKRAVLDIALRGEPVLLVVTSPDGSRRFIEGYRLGGGNDTWDAGSWHVSGWQRWGLELHCPDPWWRSIPVEWRFPYGGGPGGFFPILPVSLAPSQVTETVSTLEMVGDVESYPEWVITGPCTSVTATEVKSGRTWTLNAPLDAGQQVKVRTDPRDAAEGPMVVGPDGSDWYRYMAPPYDLWPLPVESPQVRIEMAGAATGSGVTAVVNPLWETAL